MFIFNYSFPCMICVTHIFSMHNACYKIFTSQVVFIYTQWTKSKRVSYEICRRHSTIFYYVCPTEITYPSDFFTTSSRQVLHTHQNNINGNYFLCMMCVRQFLQVKWFSLMQCIHTGCMSCEFLTTDADDTTPFF